MNDYLLLNEEYIKNRVYVYEIEWPYEGNRLRHGKETLKTGVVWKS